MKAFLIISFLLGAMAMVVNSQDACFTSTIPLFSSAAVRPANQGDVTKYFVIGGLFDVHKLWSNAYNCSSEASDIGLVNVVAFFWAIDKYLVETSNAKSLSVGGIAFDNCMRPEQTIENIYDVAQCRINVENMQRENVVAYVGPYTNEDSERAGALADDLGLTVFSPMADTDNLNYMNQKTLLKMRPSFTYDLKAIVEFLKYVNGKFVIILYSGNDMYWRTAYDQLTSLITSSSTPLCIHYTADIDKVTDSDVFSNLADRTTVKYIIPLVPYNRLSNLMTGLNQRNLNFIFILTSRIGRNLYLMRPSQTSSNNSIVIEPSEPSDFTARLTDFSNFLSTFPSNNTLPGITGNNVGTKWLSDYFKMSPFPSLVGQDYNSTWAFGVYRTLLSVKIILQAMDSVLQDCNLQNRGYQLCDDYRNLNSKVEKLYTRMKNASDLFMANSGDLNYMYSSYSYYIFSNNNLSKFTKIGDMMVNNNGDVTATFNINLKDQSLFRDDFSDPTCPTSKVGQCCEVTTTTTTTTTTTPGSTTNATVVASTPSLYSQVWYRSGQEVTGGFCNVSRNDSEYGTRFDRGQKWIIPLGVLAGLGILCVIVFEVYIWYKFLATRVDTKWDGQGEGIKWRTMWLGQLLLFGVFLCYLVLFAYLPIPTKATCGITRFGVGVSYAFCFAVLLVKIMVILTSKPSSDVLLPGDIDTTNYLKGSYQFLLFLLAVGMQIVIDAQWLITVQPEAVNVTSNNGESVWICNHYTWQAGSAMNNMSSFVRTEFENHLMSLIYVMVLILITTVLALKAHGIITNHRESVFVGIAAGFTIPIWLAWGLVGGLNKSHDYAHEFGDACIAFGLLATATLVLFAMFLPKVRHLVNMGVEGIYIEDDRSTIYGGSVILAPSSYKSKGSGSIIHVSNGIYNEPVVISNGDPTATFLRHPGSVYSVPGNYIKHPDSLYGGSTRVLRVTDDLRGRHPQKRSQSEVAYGSSRKPRSYKGTLPRSKSQSNLGAL